MSSACRRSRCVPCVLLAAILFLNLSSVSAAEITPPGAVEVPDWALGVLSIRQLSSSLDKTGAYANNLLPNSAELARQIIMGGLFKLPMNAGVKNGSALIVALDPLSTGVKGEPAFILPVGDAAALKNAFVEAYGAPAEKDGVMTFTLPQPIPEPDKMLLTKIVKDRLLAAPNALVLKKLEECVEGKSDEVLAGKGSADLLVTIKVANIKRAYGQMADIGLAILSQMAGPQRAEESKAATDLLQKLWQTDVLELRLELNAAGTNGTLEFLATPLKGTALADQLAVSSKPVDASALRLLPPGAALFGTWNVNGAELMKSFQPRIANPDTDAAKASADLERALVDLIQLANGSVGASMGLAEDNSPVEIFAVQVSDPKMFRDGVKSVWLKWQKAIKESTRADAKSGTPAVQWKFKDSSEAYAGVSIESFQAQLEGLSGDQQGIIQSAVGWPPTIRFALSGDKALIAFGKDGLEALKQSIDRDKNGPAENAAVLNASLLTEPRFVGSITTTNLARLVFANLPLTPKISLERLTRGLTNAPIAISGKADKMFYLRAEVPIAAADAVGTIFQRLQGVNLRFKDSISNGGDAPAPPPP